MFALNNRSDQNKAVTQSLLAKLTDAEKYKHDSNRIEINTKSYSDQISKKLIQKVEASLS